MEKVEVYTDGACSQIAVTGRGPGGWGISIWKEDGSFVEDSGGEPHTTNQRMELLAAIKALEAMGEPTRVRIFSDSAYLINCFKDKWYVGWRSRDWKNSKDQPVANRDLWERLLGLYDRHQVEFIKVKGHAHDAKNNRCDELARAACADQRRV